jgi:hypothetical protein
MVEEKLKAYGADRIGPRFIIDLERLFSVFFSFPNAIHSKLYQKGSSHHSIFTTLYSANTLIVCAPSTVTVKHKMMSAAGLVILAVQYLLWSMTF